MFKSIKAFYDSGLYDRDDVKKFVVAKWISKEEYSEITGVTYYRSN